MHFKKQGNYGYRAGRGCKNRLYAPFYLGMQPRFEFTPRRGVAKHPARQHATLFGRNQFVDYVVGVDRRETRLPEIARHEGFSAGYPAGQTNPHAASPRRRRGRISSPPREKAAPPPRTRDCS